MSKIGGIIGYGASAATAAQICEEMATALKIYEQDTHGTYFSEDACLLHVGNTPVNQPARAILGQKAYVVVFDGELYNKEELRKELSDLGYRFPDSGDASIVLYGYMAWGQKCVERFNGIFAFALWDGQQLFMARDRLGLKTLYYSTGAYGLVFASTLKAVLAHPQISPTINAQGAAEIILLGPGRTPGCGIFKDVFELEPGNYATYSLGKVSKVQYWRLKAKPHAESFEETTATIRELLKASVKRQTPINHHAAILLSGGLDSSTIAALSGLRKSFSVDYLGNDKHFTANAFQPESDDEYISHMVNHLHLTHKRVVLSTNELTESLTDAMEARGLPGMADVDSSLLLFLHRVKEEVPVALSGEGADEIFGGYPWYQDEKRLYSETFPWSQGLEYRTKFMQPEMLQQLKCPEEFVNSRFKKTIAAAETLYDESEKETRIRQMFMLNLNWFLQTLGSRNSTMATRAGISVRTPFLDHNLVEYVYNIPWSFKNYRDREKGLLRESMENILPKSVLWRKKSPFPKTHNPAYLTRIKEMLSELDSSQPLFSLVPKQSIDMLLQEDSGVNWYGQLMSYPQTMAYFLQINAWMKNYSVILG